VLRTESKKEKNSKGSVGEKTGLTIRGRRKGFVTRRGKENTKQTRDKPNIEGALRNIGAKGKGQRPGKIAMKVEARGDPREVTQKNGERSVRGGCAEPTGGRRVKERGVTFQKSKAGALTP